MATSTLYILLEWKPFFKEPSFDHCAHLERKAYDIFNCVSSVNNLPVVLEIKETLNK